MTIAVLASKDKGIEVCHVLDRQVVSFPPKEAPDDERRTMEWKEIITLVITGVGGASVSLLGAWIAFRRARAEADKITEETGRASRADAFTQLNQVVTDLRLDKQRLEARFDAADKDTDIRIKELNAEHLACQKESAKLSEQVAGLSRQVEEMKNRLIEAMKGRKGGAI